MNKRGQFFLVAAIIIVGFVIGLATAVNTIQASDSNEAFYDLASEVGEETKEVLDYGTYNAQDTNALMQEFLETYANYISQEEVLFVYGDSTGLEALFFDEITPGNVGINTGAVPGLVTIQYTTGEQADVSYDDVQEIVHVSVGDIIYNFPLREGENFFFVIGTERDGEKYVAQGK